MKNIIITTILILSALVAGAKTVQTGIVREYKGKAKKTALAGVELQVYPAQSTASDRNGNFRLEFLTLKPGERINVRRIEKEGYEIFNKDALEQWNLNPTAPFMIVMCRSNMFKQLKDTYYKNSGERYARQYRKAQDELKRLKDQNKIQQKEYIERLEQLEQEYGRQLENLDNYVDRFARIDLSEISPVEQEIIELVQAGKIDEAIAKYEELNAKAKLLESISKRNAVDSAISKLSQAKEEIDEISSTLYSVIERQIQTLQLGGTENNDKIRTLYCDIADADSSAVEWHLDTGLFLLDYLADYDTAMRYFQMALHNAIRIYGADSPLVASAYNDIGMAYSELGDYSKELDYYQKALEIREKVQNFDNPDLAMNYNNVGTVYYHLGDYDKAVEYCQKALDIYERIMDADDLAISWPYNNLGFMYECLGNYPKALEYMGKALEVREKILTVNHPDVATCYNNIGGVYNNMGNTARALENYQKALEIRERTLDSNHPQIAVSYNNVGTAYCDLKNYTKALEYCNKGLEILKRAIGPSHPYVAVMTNNIGEIYIELEDYAKALELYREALKIAEESQSPDSLHIATFLTNIGKAYYGLKDYPQALANYQKALDIRLANLDKDHPEIATSYNNIGTLYSETGDYPKAMDYYQKALNIRQKIYGAEHKWTKDVSERLAECEAKMKEDNP